ncbi:fibrillin-1 [Electrophorus electricus]|uniref:fibrillin-1 n=1 Tax=Electrophorus electricus TaxID=8005 RepID=UPI0015CFE56A|nr:fibrillin-1 [Electrophorus electricus]
MTRSPDVTTTDAYLHYPAVTKAAREQTAVGEDSAAPVDAHRLMMGNIDGVLNDISGSDRICKNRASVADTQNQGNVESPSTAGKQVPESLAWSSFPFTTPKLPGVPVRIRRPVCPYPPLPAHGTFYFRTMINPGPFQYKHYIQYACYPGYTLANGDVYSYCLHDGQWSGATPMCIEVTPCSLNNGGCSQVCQVSHENRAECHCQPGFLLLQDHRTCRDLDECVEGLHQCQQVCENMLGSYRCSCRHGFKLSADRMSCSDVDECAVAMDRVGCVFGCVNTLGSFLCRCPPGHSLNPDGRCEGRWQSKH